MPNRRRASLRRALGARVRRVARRLVVHPKFHHSQERHRQRKAARIIAPKAASRKARARTSSRMAVAVAVGVGVGVWVWVNIIESIRPRWVKTCFP